MYCAAEENLEAEVASACAADMMSDVLAFVKDHAVLITGLCNPPGHSHRRNDGYRMRGVCEGQGARRNEHRALPRART